MPDATITSTASTFGTISGVFSADQSTISGTISGIVPGTLTGSVGVPGPAGAAGAPGVGVPVGGTAGQYLQKTTTGVDYATDWVTLNLGNYALLSGADFTGRVSVPGITGGEFVNFPGFNIVPTQTEPTDKVNGDLWVYDDEGLTPSKFRVFLESETQNIATESWVTTSFAPKASPVFTGDPRAPTPASGDNDTSIATTAFVKVQGYITSAALTGYAPLASPVFTGNPTAPTPTFGDNDTSIATTAFVQSALLGGTAVARNLEVEVRNQSGSTIAAGSIVYISGATGNKPLITLAQANNDANSAQTIGFVKTSIANNGTGFVIVRGELENIDTSALTEGVQLYLSPTTAGTWTTTKPSAPQHLVYVGIVIRSHPTLGTILVAVQNGYELGEIHDVALGTLANNDLLAYESSTDLWKNKTFSALGLLTSADAASTYAPIASPTFTGTVTIPAGASISGFAPLASPGLTGNVTITSNSTGPALFIEQAGTGNILTLHDQASDTTFVAIDQNGKVNTIPSEVTIGAGFNIAHGAAPNTPVNGDIWTTTSGLFMRQNGTTQQYVDFAGTQTINGSKTFSNASSTFGSSTAAGTINVASGATISGATKVATGGVVGSTTTTTIGPVLGASTTSIGGTTAASTLNLATGATLTATTKAVNIGTSGVAGSTTNITIGSTTGTSTTTLQGITNGVTEAVDTNNTELATTAFVVGQAGSATPIVDGTAAVGTSLRYARQDHVHPTDTTRAPLASPTFTGTVTIPAGASISGFAPLASPAFTGTPSLPTGTTGVTQTAGNNTTAVATTAFVRADNNVKAWVNFNGTGTPAIRASFNVSSLTDSGVGSYRINFTTAMTDANYVVAGISSFPGTDFGLASADTLLAAYAPVYTMQNAAPATLRDNTQNLFVILR